MTSLRYCSIRDLSSSWDATRIPRKRVLAILEENSSMMLSQDPCLGVKMNSNRFGTVFKYARVSCEV